MGWYDADWRYRIALTLGTGSKTTPTDCTIAIPADLDHFWENVLSSGNDVRVTAADGITLLTYDLDAFNTTTRVGTIELDNVPIVDNQQNFGWLYYGNAAAADARTSFSPSTPATGFIAQDAPAPGRTLRVTSERPGAVRPSVQIAKAPDEELIYYFDVEDQLTKRSLPYNGDLRWLEVRYAELEVLAGGTPQSMGNPIYTGLIEHGGRRYVRAEINGGTDGDDYQVRLTVQTTSDSADYRNGFQGFYWLKVRNPNEA